MLAKRTDPAPAPGAAADGLGRGAAGPGDDRRLPRRRPASSRPTATARPRPARSPPTSPASRCARARWAGRCRGSRPASPIRRGGVGELQLRAASSPTFFSHYLDGERFEGEWWPTGDLVRADADGYLFFEGRDDDIILSSGYRIGPFEVESALQSHPAVAEAAAVAAPDPERGAVVRAIVVPREREPSEELARELQEHCKRVDRALQVPPHRRVRRRAAEDHQRQDQARPAAPGVTWPDGGDQQPSRPTRRRVAPRLLRGGRPRATSRRWPAFWEPGGPLDVIHGVVEMRVPDDLRSWFGNLFAAFPDFTLRDPRRHRQPATKRRCAGTPPAPSTAPRRFEGLDPNGAPPRPRRAATSSPSATAGSSTTTPT